MKREESNFLFDDDQSYSTLGTEGGGGRGGLAPLDTSMDADADDFYNPTVPSPAHMPSPTNHQAFFDSTYVVPPKKERPDWDESFVQRSANVQDSRPQLVLNRGDRETRTIDRIERFRKLAAGKTDSVTTSEFRDEGMVRKAEWREEMDRKFNKAPSTGARISPRSMAINRDVKDMLRQERNRQAKLDEKIKRWEEEVAKERTEKIVARRKGKKNLIGGMGQTGGWDE